ncbi:sensor histidine kinase [Roseococcus sp. DSY-14]|uniref:sensor histidine kinase n=1 Tax=Roseococcus sp. DSY-14 TaxID=3369650 RepID=UPI00387AC49E
MPKPAPSFRRRLLVLALGLALPLVGLAALAAWRAAEAEHARFEAQLLATSRALAHAVEGELEQGRARLSALAASGDLRHGRLDEFVAAVRPTLPPGAAVALYDADGALLANTGRSASSPERRSGAQPFIAEALRRQGASVSAQFSGGQSGQPRIMVALPLEREGRRELLGLVLTTERFGELLAAQAIPAGWTAAVVDSAHRIVARTRDGAAFQGREARPGVRELLGRPGGGLLRDVPTLDGVRSVSAVVPAPRSGYGVSIAAPSPPRWGAALDAAGPALALGGALALLGLGVALLTGRQLTRALGRLAAGPGLPLTSTGVAEVDAAARKMLRDRQGRDAAVAALRLSEERLRLALEAFSGGSYDWRAEDGRVQRSPGLLAMLGEAADDGSPAWWTARIHPEDRAGWEATRAEVLEGRARLFDARYRLRHADGRWLRVWHRALVQRDARGRVSRILGFVLDVSAEAEAKQRAELLAREMDHRVKNAFALVAGLVSASAADHPEAAEFADALRERLGALAAAHDLVRRGDGPPRMRALAARLAAPYGEAVEILGEDPPLAGGEVQPVALVLHEWLTNSVKHGALSRAEGRVRLRLAAQDGRIRLEWQEAGGPPARAPARRGFGEELVQATVEHQLQGAIAAEWRPEGLRLSLEWPGEALERASATG